MNETIILVAVFTAVLILSWTVLRLIAQRQDVKRNVQQARRRGEDPGQRDLDQMLGTGNEQIRYYLDTVQNAGPNSLRMRLVQAGNFSKGAIWRFHLIRFCVAAALFLIVQFVFGMISADVTRAAQIFVGLVAGGLGFILCSYVLEKQGERRMREYRKIFPDLMDLLLVCVDSGLSIEAAFDRVTREFLKTIPDFGVQLSIVNLEIRAGRPLHEALNNLATRVRIEEARMLAVLFRQSEELGSSVSRTLRTFAKEMRQMRIIRAEEKANVLPVKMLFPMAFFMFPVSIIIVLIPILMTIAAFLKDMIPD